MLFVPTKNYKTGDFMERVEMDILECGNVSRRIKDIQMFQKISKIEF